MRRILTRHEWGARPPERRYAISIPTPKLYLHHSAGSGADERTVRAIQDYHMDVRDWSDIAYSFLIDNDAPDVDIFEGRGVGIAGGHTRGQNTVSHAICLIGNFEDELPTEEALEATAWLVALGANENWWPSRITGGHRDAPGANTSCPGDALYAAIPHINERVEQLLRKDQNVIIAGFEWVDVDEWPSWAKESIIKNIKKGVIRGVDVGHPSEKKKRFAPDEPLTRAQAAVLLDRVGHV